MSLLQVIIIALIVLIAVGASVVFVRGREAERKKQVLNRIRGQGSTGSRVQVSERDEQNKRRAEIAKKLKESKDEDGAGGKKKKTPISLMIAQAGLNISIKKFWIMSVILMVVLTGLAFMMGHSPFVLLMVAVIGLLGVPRFILKKMAARRQKKFLMEFPDALEAVVRLLKAGMPVSEAVLMISREFTGPVGEEMSRVYDKQKIGVPLHEAALDATKRMPLAEMKMFATGLSIQAQTGSSLSEVLMNLSGVIRARFRLKRKIKALSSEAIASASIIGALPNVVAGGMYFVNYDYLQVLFVTPTGNFLLGIAGGMMLVGIFVMRGMINFKI